MFTNDPPQKCFTGAVLTPTLFIKDLPRKSSSKLCPVLIPFIDDPISSPFLCWCFYPAFTLTTPPSPKRKLARSAVTPILFLFDWGKDNFVAFNASKMIFLAKLLLKKLDTLFHLPKAHLLTCVFCLCAEYTVVLGEKSTFVNQY